MLKLTEYVEIWIRKRPVKERGAFNVTTFCGR